MTAHETTNPLLRGRWSPVIFDPHHQVTPAQIATLIEAARWAPSFGNTQPWRFVVAPRGSTAHELLLPLLSRGNQDWVPRASLVLLGATQTGRGPDGKDATGDYARYDLGQAMAHLSIQAAAMGLHSHQFAGFDHRAYAAAVAAPAHFSFLAGIAIGVRGVAAEAAPSLQEREQRVRRRRAAAETAYADIWGTPWGEVQ